LSRIETRRYDDWYAVCTQNQVPEIIIQVSWQNPAFSRNERNVHMKMSVAALLTASLAGCTTLQPVQLRSAPEPSRQEISQLRNVQSRTISTKLDSVFPNVVYVLMDNGYVVRSANKDVGLISFYQQWKDSAQSDANISQEGTAIFSASGPNSTDVRLTLTGGWQRLEISGGGPKTIDTAMMAGVQQNIPAQEYKKLLDVLEQGLTSPRR
jgi:hypothetical protein